jgi:hypothetical protein
MIFSFFRVLGGDIRLIEKQYVGQVDLLPYQSPGGKHKKACQSTAYRYRRHDKGKQKELQ